MVGQEQAPGSECAHSLRALCVRKTDAVALRLVAFALAPQVLSGQGLCASELIPDSGGKGM